MEAPKGKNNDLDEFNKAVIAVRKLKDKPELDIPDYINLCQYQNIVIKILLKDSKDKHRLMVVNQLLLDNGICNN